MASVFIDQNVECVVKIAELKELRAKAKMVDEAIEYSDLVEKATAYERMSDTVDATTADTGAEDLPSRPPDMSESNVAEVDRAEGHLAGEDA